MKKIVPLLLLLFLLVGCGRPLNKNEMAGNVKITEIDRFPIEQEPIQCAVELKEEVLQKIEPIVTNQNAVAVGTHIIEALHSGGKLPAYTLASITHSTENNVWCFEYAINQPNVDADNLIDCGGLYVTIDGNKRTLLNAWIEE